MSAHTGPDDPLTAGPRAPTTPTPPSTPPDARDTDAGRDVGTRA